MEPGVRSIKSDLKPALWSFSFLRNGAFFQVANVRDTLTGGKLSVISQLSGRQFKVYRVARSVFAGSVRRAGGYWDSERVKETGERRWMCIKNGKSKRGKRKDGVRGWPKRSHKPCRHGINSCVKYAAAANNPSLAKVNERVVFVKRPITRIKRFSNAG